MVIRAQNSPFPNIHGLADVSARVMRPLDRREGLFTSAKMATAGFTPAQTDKLLIIAERWYFKALPGSLGNRFYYDTLAQKLVFRGRLNDKESGASDLTAGPDPLNLLEPNVMTPDEFAQIRNLSTNAVWQTAIGDIYLLSQNPNAVTALAASTTNPVNLQGIKAAPASPPSEKRDFWSVFANALAPITALLNSELDHLDSFYSDAPLCRITLDRDKWVAKIRDRHRIWIDLAFDGIRQSQQSPDYVEYLKKHGDLSPLTDAAFAKSPKRASIENQIVGFLDEAHAATCVK